MVQYMQNFEKVNESSVDLEGNSGVIEVSTVSAGKTSQKKSSSKAIATSSDKSSTKAEGRSESKSNNNVLKESSHKKEKLNLGALTPCGTATLRGVFMSPRKANEVVKLIRRKKSKSALSILKRCPRLAATHVYNLLYSAVANSGYIDDSYVMEAIVGRGPCAKRVEFKGRGRTGTRSKFMCYIRIVLGVQGVNSGTKG